MMFFLARFFTEEKHADQFMRGSLYANRLAYFRDLEGDPSRSDAYEGVGLMRGELELSATSGAHTERTIVLERNLAAPMEFRMNWTEHINLICMNAAHSGSYANIPADQVGRFKREQIEISEECLEFGGHAVLITNVRKFVKRVKCAVRKIEGYYIDSKLIRYSNELPIDPTSVDTIFHKRDRYKNQREYRFAIFTGSEIRNPLILETGDLSDIAFRCDAAEINDGIKMSFRRGDGQS